MLKRCPSGRNAVQMVSTVRTTQPPFSIMMFRLLMLTSRIASTTWTKRVCQPAMNTRQASMCKSIRKRTSFGLENAR